MDPNNFRKDKDFSFSSMNGDIDTNQEDYQNENFSNIGQFNNKSKIPMSYYFPSKPMFMSQNEELIGGTKKQVRFEGHENSNNFNDQGFISVEKKESGPNFNKKNEEMFYGRKKINMNNINNMNINIINQIPMKLDNNDLINNFNKLNLNKDTSNMNNLSNSSGIKKDLAYNYYFGGGVGVNPGSGDVINRSMMNSQNLNDFAYVEEEFAGGSNMNFFGRLEDVDNQVNYNYKNMNTINKPSDDYYNDNQIMMQNPNFGQQQHRMIGNMYDQNQNFNKMKYNDNNFKKNNFKGNNFNNKIQNHHQQFRNHNNQQHNSNQNFSLRFNHNNMNRTNEQFDDRDYRKGKF